IQSGGVTITFAGVSTAGRTHITVIDPSTAGALPAGYLLTGASLGYEITTTAGYTGPIDLCFSVPGASDATAFAALRMLHGEGTWVDRTSTADYGRSSGYA